MKIKLKRVSSYLLNLVMGIIIIFIIMSGFINYTYNKTGDVGHIFGISILTVKTGSMEPMLSPGDVIFIKQVEKLQPGDVATYFKSKGNIITHRVKSVENDKYIFKGDANNIEDQEMVESRQLRGSYIFHIPGLYIFIRKVTHPIGIGIIVGLIILYYAMTKLIKQYKKVSNMESEESEKIGGAT